MTPVPTNLYPTIKSAIQSVPANFTNNKPPGKMIFTLHSCCFSFSFFLSFLVLESRTSCPLCDWSPLISLDALSPPTAALRASQSNRPLHRCIFVAIIAGHPDYCNPLDWGPMKLTASCSDWYLSLWSYHWGFLWILFISPLTLSVRPIRLADLLNFYVLLILNLALLCRVIS